MGDIQGRKDIEFLVNKFYDKVKQDTLIGFFFLEVASLNFNTHLPKMYDFWESILFKKGIYNGNPMLSHIILHQKEKIKNIHIERWLLIWEETLNSCYSGKNAQEALQRAQQIASLIKYKLSIV